MDVRGYTLFSLVFIYESGFCTFFLNVLILSGFTISCNNTFQEFTSCYVKEYFLLSVLNQTSAYIISFLINAIYSDLFNYHIFSFLVWKSMRYLQTYTAVFPRSLYTKMNLFCKYITFKAS